MSESVPLFGRPPADSGSPYGDPELTFARRYCALRGFERESYADAVLRECLYPHARLVWRWLPARWFTADRAFVENIGRLRQRREFHNLMLDFMEDPESHGWLRDVAHLRVSVRRVHRLVWFVFESRAGSPAATEEPADA